MVRINPLLAVSRRLAADAHRLDRVITALFAATIAVAQNDIKKVLAYSTVSQLGYMFLAVGSGAYVAAVFHMVTHAFFKAAAVPRVGLGHPRHARRAGHAPDGPAAQAHADHGGTFIVGWLAIAGVPPLAGFWSKDEILDVLACQEPGAVRRRLVTALLTAYYMTRQVIMVFFGEARGRTTPTSTARTATSSRTRARRSMLLPLVVLAGCRSSAGAAAAVPDEAQASSTGSSRWSSSARPHRAALGRRHKYVLMRIAVVGRARRHRRSPTRVRSTGQGRSSRDPRRRLVLRPGVSAFMGGPGRRRSRRAWFDSTSSTARSTARRARARTGRRAAQGAERLRAQYAATSASASCCCSAGSSSCGDRLMTAVPDPHRSCSCRRRRAAVALIAASAAPSCQARRRCSQRVTAR
jgi:hypothetical protein